MVYEPLRRKVKVGFSGNNELQYLQAQVNKMLDITPDSFVLVYTKSGFVFVPAISVNGITYMKDGNYIYGKNIRLFFQEFLMCFIGDHRISAVDDQTLAIMAEKNRSRYALLLQLRYKGG